MRSCGQRPETSSSGRSGSSAVERSDCDRLRLASGTATSTATTTTKTKHERRRRRLRSDPIVAIANAVSFRSRTSSITDRRPIAIPNGDTMKRRRRSWYGLGAISHRANRSRTRMVRVCLPLVTCHPLKICLILLFANLRLL